MYVCVSSVLKYLLVNIANIVTRQCRGKTITKDLFIKRKIAKNVLTSVPKNLEFLTFQSGSGTKAEKCSF
jgi:hypothetical protein